MHCASCSTIISRALSRSDGILKANVNLSTNKASVEYDDSKIGPKKIIEVIKKKGFGASESSGKTDYDKEAKKRKKEFDRLKADFYLGLFFAIPVFILGMFFMKNPIPFQDYIMWTLATPVQFIVGWPMYKSALAALKAKTANMDTLIVLGTSAA